jgi:hypothetical protein
LTNGTLEVRITTNGDVTVPAGYYGNGFGLRIRLMVTENFSIASGTASATGTIIDNNNAPTVATISCFGY